MIQYKFGSRYFDARNLPYGGLNYWSQILKTFLFVVCLYSIPQKADGQSKEKLDSLMSVVKNEPDDTLKLQNLSDIVDNAADGVWQKYNEDMRTLAKKLMNDKSPAVKIAAKKFLAVTDNNDAYDFGEKGNYKQALAYYYQCVKIQEELSDLKNLANTFNNMGAIYDRDGDPEKALENFTNALNLEVHENDFADMISTLSNIGSLYFKLGKYDSALLYYERCLDVVNKHHFMNDKVAILYKDLGCVMEKTGDYEKGLEYFKTGLEVAEKGGWKFAETANMLGIAEIYFDKGLVVQSLGYAQKALAMAMKTDNLKNITAISTLLTNIYKKQGNFKEALGMYELEIKARDSLFREENHRASVHTQFQYEFDKKQDSTKADQAKKDAVKAKELENQKRIRNYISIGLLIVLGFLVLVFRQRNKIAKEKQRSEELLLNILPEEVADELKNTGEAKVKSFESVTVMFTDFKGFTIISESLTPEQLVAEIDYCFRAFDNIINKYGIEKIKTIGDSYMCAGGLPKPNVTHATDVVNAAIEIRDFMLRYKEEKLARGETPFEVRIGVNTGPVVAGIVGVKKFAYDIWGDAVNFASRMESSGEAGKVNISGFTYEKVKDRFNCEYRGKVYAKSKGDVDMYFVEQI